MGRSVRNSVYLLAVVGGLTFFAGLVFAQANPIPIPMSIAPGPALPTGLQSTVTFDARGVGTAANAGYYTRPVLVSNNTLAGLGKGLLRRAAPVAAMTAAVAAAGWAINELSGQVTEGGEGSPTIAAGDSYWVASSVALGYYSSSAGLPYKLCMATFGYQASSHCPNAALGPIVANPPGYNEYRVVVSSAPHYGEYLRHYHVAPSPFTNSGYVAATPVSNANLGQLVANNPALAAAALRNPDGSVNRNPDVMAAAQALAAELAATNPAQQPDPVAEWDTGQQGGPAEGAAPEFPAFCAWASVVCDAITWAQDDQDEHTDPVIDDIVPDLSATTFNSGLGGGSCPPDIVVGQVMGGEVVFPLSGFCAAADTVRPIVLAGASLLALFIVGGFRRAS